MGPFCRKERIQDSFRQKTSTFPQSSILQPNRKQGFRRRGPEPSPKEGSGESICGRSRILLSDILSSKEKWKTKTHNRSVQTEYVSEHPVFQHGNSEQSQKCDSPQRLGHFIRSDGCVPSRTHPYLIPEIPTVLSKGPSISVPGAPFRASDEPICFYSPDVVYSNSFTSKSYCPVSLSGRLVGQESKSSEIDQRQTIHTSIDYVSGSFNQSREIRANSITELRFHRDGIQNCRQHSSGTMGQGESHFTLNPMVSVSEICHSTNVSVTSGKTKCSCSICNSGQTTSTPSSNGTVFPVETPCSSNRTQDLYHRPHQVTPGLVERQGTVHSRSCTQSTSCGSHGLLRREYLRLGSTPRTGGCSVSWSLDSRPISSTHQCSGNESRSVCFEGVSASSKQLFGYGSNRQLVSGCLYSQRGRNTFSNAMYGGVGDPSLVSEQRDFSSSPAYSRQEQYPGRQAFEDVQTNINGMVSESDRLQLGMSDDGTSEHRFVRDTSQQQTSVVRVTHSGQQGTLSGCLINELGQDSCLRVSSVPHNSSDSQQDSLIPVQDSTDRSILASGLLVSRTSTVTGSDSHFSAVSSKSVKSTKRKNLPSKSSNACSSRLDFIKQSVRDQEFSQKIADHVSKARRPSTRKVYDSKWDVFTSWCRRRKISPVSASPSNIADFLLYQFEEKKCQVSTIKGYRSMISNTLKFKSGKNIGSDPIISELIKSFEFQRPVQRSLFPKWDLACVLTSLCKEPYEPLNKASMLHLTQKTVFLLTLATAGRISEIHAFSVDPEHLRFNQSDDSVSLRTQSGFIAKNQLPSVCPGEILIPNLAKTLKSKDFNRCLCPVRALKYYIKRTESLRKDRKRLFLPIKGNHDISKGSISGWISSVIRLAYKNLSSVKLSMLKIRAHELRALSTSWAYFNKTPMEDIIRAAVWSNNSVFAKFYLRDLSRQSQNLSLLGPVVSAQRIVGGPDGLSSQRR